ncbi:hypothetical protein BKA70DRAFT_1425275 [Coprinopsis sp. MPI-PUGE-AT-0042]|nr:hypothetical protein BKA70DRAFT_1425275 [Coprinopsis sp. MPI-PUGE-AT-0042]
MTRNEKRPLAGMDNVTDAQGGRRRGAGYEFLSHFARPKLHTSFKWALLKWRPT